MELYFTKSFERDYKKLPYSIQKRLDKQLFLFLQNSKHPSLRVKKVEGFFNIWEGRISKEYRFTFQIEGNHYIIRRVGTHSILKRP